MRRKKKRSGRRKQGDVISGGRGGGEVHSTLRGAIAKIPHFALSQANSCQCDCINRFRGFMATNGSSGINDYIIVTGLAAAMKRTGTGQFFGAPETVMENNVRTMYNLYRVYDIKTSATFVNIEAFPVEIGLLATNNVVSQNNSSINTISLNPKSKRKLVGGGASANTGVYGSLQRIFHKVSVEQIFGGNMVLFDDNFVGTTNSGGTPSVPSNNVYLNIYAVPVNPSNTFTTAGIQFDIVVTQKIIFQEVIAQSV